MPVSRIAARMQYAWYLEVEVCMRQKDVPDDVRQYIIAMAMGIPEDAKIGAEGLQASQEVLAYSARYFAHFNCVNKHYGIP